MHNYSSDWVLRFDSAYRRVGSTDGEWKRRCRVRGLQRVDESFLEPHLPEERVERGGSWKLYWWEHNYPGLPFLEPDAYENNCPAFLSNVNATHRSNKCLTPIYNPPRTANRCHALLHNAPHCSNRCHALLYNAPHRSNDSICQRSDSIIPRTALIDVPNRSNNNASAPL